MMSSNQASEIGVSRLRIWSVEVPCPEAPSAPLSGCSFAAGCWGDDEEEDEDVDEDGDGGCDRHRERGTVGGRADEAGTGQPGGDDRGECERGECDQRERMGANGADE